MTRILLASQSPRRRELLARLGWQFEVIPATGEERIAPGTPPQRAVIQLAHDKAAQIAQAHPECLVVGADTVVVLDGASLGKPQDETQARRMLRSLSGRAHRVYTGVCLCYGPYRCLSADMTQVYMQPLSDAQIEAYLATGESMDKAGAYALQGRAGAFIPKIEGCPNNVIGLPLHLVLRMARALEAATGKNLV